MCEDVEAPGPISSTSSLAFCKDPLVKKPSQRDHLRQNATALINGSGGGGSGDGDEDEEVASVVTVFHILLGVAIFVCMALLFIFGTVVLHR